MKIKLHRRICISNISSLTQLIFISTIAIELFPVMWFRNSMFQLRSVLVTFFLLQSLEQLSSHPLACKHGIWQEEVALWLCWGILLLLLCKSPLISQNNKYLEKNHLQRFIHNIGMPSSRNCQYLACVQQHALHWHGSLLFVLIRVKV